MLEIPIKKQKNPGVVGQVTSVEISNKLKDLGVTEPSIFFRDYRGSKEDEIDMWERHASEYSIDNVNCYTAGELGEMLPDHFFTQRSGVDYFVDCKDDNHKAFQKYVFAPTEADARALMLIHLLENNEKEG